MTNEQYSITQYWIGRFRREIAECEEAKDLDAASKALGICPLYTQLCLDASRCVLADLEEELAEEDEARRLAVIH